MGFADSLLKALLPVIPPGAQELPINPSEIALSTGVRHFIDSVSITTDYMGPNQPMAPIAPHGTLPRAFDYPFGSNLYFQPRQEQPGTPDFQTLRNLARYDIVRLCIETRKAQILEMPRSFRVKKEAGEKKRDWQQRSGEDPRVKFLEDFFRVPDHEHKFLSWMNMVIEEVLVTDALAIWPAMDEDNNLLSLRVVDGATIKPLHDPQGWRPNPPNPAFQQIIKGSPAINLTAALCDDCKAHGWHKDMMTPGGRGRCQPLVYEPFNPTVNRFYGWSPVEQILNTIMIGMNRMVSQASLYTEGNLPEMLISLASEASAQQLGQFQGLFDQVAGNVGIKRRVRFIPEAKHMLQTKDPMIKDDRDDWLARVCCYALSVAPNALVKQMNRASSQQIQQSAVEEGKLPTLGRLSELINSIVVQYFGEDFGDVEHAYDVTAESDPNTSSQIADRAIKNGSRSINETRDEDGLEPVDGGDVCMIYLPTGPIPLAGAADMAQEQHDAAIAPKPAPVIQQGLPPGQNAPKQLPPGASGKQQAAPPQKAKPAKPGKKGAAPAEAGPAAKEAKKLMKMFPVSLSERRNGRDFLY